MKNSPIRVKLATRIWALRALQRQEGVFPKFWLSRGTEPRTLATVDAECSLDRMLASVCQAWDECYLPDLLPEYGANMPLSARITQSEQAGLDFSNVTVQAQERGVAWEDFTERVFILSDHVPATDEQYADIIEGFWAVHQSNQVKSEEEKASFAMYLALKERFEGAGAWPGWNLK